MQTTKRNLLQRLLRKLPKVVDDEWWVAGIVMLLCLALSALHGWHAYVTLRQNGNMNTIVVWYGRGNGNMFLYPVWELIVLSALWFLGAVVVFVWAWVRTRRTPEP